MKTLFGGQSSVVKIQAKKLKIEVFPMVIIFHQNSTQHIAKSCHKIPKKINAKKWIQKRIVSYSKVTKKELD